MNVQKAEAVAASAKVKLRMEAATREFFETLMQEKPSKEQRHLRLLIENQLDTLRNRSGRCVWHIEVLEWCTDVYRRNPGAYEHMWKGGFLKLPHPDTCRKRASSVQITSGECRELFELLKKRLANLSPDAVQREMALLFDEINIVGDIAFKVKNKEYEFFGFIDVSVGATPDLYDTEVPKPISRSEFIKKQIATHALVFQVAELSGETTPLRFRQVVGVYGVTALNADILDQFFWEVVSNLHFISGVRIVVSICDGASCNRLFQKMHTHQMGRRTPNAFQPGRAWCPNPFIKGAKIWFMSDPAHWIKKVVTHWEKSKPGGVRYLRIPDFLVQLVLSRCPPPDGHVHRNPEYGSSCGMEFYCRVFGRLYMLMGASRQQHYESLTDERLQELRDILAIVRAWHAHNAQVVGETAKQRASRGFSHQLFWDTQMMIEGFLGLLHDLASRHGGMFNVRVRMLNQDSLESLFGRVRMSCGSGRDPSMLKVLQAIPREEAKALATAGLHASGRAVSMTNSGQAGIVPAAVKGTPGAWVERLRIRLPLDFARQCLDARKPGAPSSHEVLWQTLRSMQAKDETRALGQGKLMFWLITARHLNKTGFSRMRVGLAIAVLCGPKEAATMADALQLLRYEP